MLSVGTGKQYVSTYHSISHEPSQAITQNLDETHCKRNVQGKITPNADSEHLEIPVYDTEPTAL